MAIDMNRRSRYDSYMIRGRRVLISPNYKAKYVRMILRLLSNVHWDIWGWYNLCDTCIPNNTFHRKNDLVPCDQEVGYHGLAWRDPSSIPV